MNKAGKIVLIIGILIVFSSFAYAECYWACLSRGESLPRGQGFPPYVCKSSCCITCAEEGHYASWNCCFYGGAQYCQCGVSGDVDQTPPTITVNFPPDDYYSSSRAVEFDITIDEPSTLYYKDSEDERRGYRKICSGCTNYKRKLSFRDGCHTVTLKAVDYSYNPGYKEVYFCVDSLSPRVSRTYPRANAYISSTFTVEYDEDMLDSITLHYKASPWTDVPLQNCPPGRRQSCSIDVNNLPEGELTYYFTVADRATEVHSRETTVYVDTTSPTIILNGQLGIQEELTFSTTRIPFDILIAEPTTVSPVELSYLDLEDPRARPRRLCSSCTEYERVVTFRDGFHRVLINATDAAGNSDSKIVEFYVDSRSPVIKRMEPRDGKYGNGNFTVQYQEDALVEVILYYTQDGTEGTASTTECESGRNQYCSIFAPGLQDGPLTYHFGIKDKADNLVLSREYDIIIDTTIPEFELNSPKEGESYYRYAPFNITGLDEPVTLEYIDHEDGSRARYRTLCSNCDSYVRERPFRRGSHDLTIRATDVAGNIFQEDVEFIIT